MNCKTAKYSTDVNGDESFGIPIIKKYYPSCYRHNVLVMLAKRLIRVEKEKNDLCKNKCQLYQKLAKRVFE